MILEIKMLQISDTPMTFTYIDQNAPWSLKLHKLNFVNHSLGKIINHKNLRPIVCTLRRITKKAFYYNKQCFCGFDRIEKAFAWNGSVFPKSIFKFPIKKRKCRTCDTSFCQLSIVKVRHDFISANNYWSPFNFMFP